MRAKLFSMDHNTNLYLGKTTFHVTRRSFGSSLCGRRPNPPPPLPFFRFSPSPTATQAIWEYQTVKEVGRIKRTPDDTFPLRVIYQPVVAGI